jgi:chromate reductase, NAD(P)H dehydrogenase (quinone)
MASRNIRILALSGSLRAHSSNSALLRAAARLVPDNAHLSLYEGLALLPPFNPDREAELYDAVAPGLRYRSDLNDPGLLEVRDLNERVRLADGLLIACPEYARGIPGAFKNALDWMVGSNAFVCKPFIQFNASPRASHAQAALRLTLETMSGVFVEEASLSVPLLNRGLSPEDILADPALAEPVRNALRAFVDRIENDEYSN